MEVNYGEHCAIKYGLNYFTIIVNVIVYLNLHIKTWKFIFHVTY